MTPVSGDHSSSDSSAALTELSAVGGVDAEDVAVPSGDIPAQVPVWPVASWDSHVEGTAATRVDLSGLLTHAEPGDVVAVVRAMLSDEHPSTLVLTRDQLRCEALEQVMRLTPDDGLAIRFLTTMSEDAAASLVGKTIAALDLTLTPGSPLLAYGAGAALDVSWRRHCPPVERSLYSELLFCRQMAGIAPGDEELGEDAFAELEELRVRLGFPDLDTFF